MEPRMNEFFLIFNNRLFNSGTKSFFIILRQNIRRDTEKMSTEPKWEMFFKEILIGLILHRGRGMHCGARGWCGEM